MNIQLFLIQVAAAVAGSTLTLLLGYVLIKDKWPAAPKPAAEKEALPNDRKEERLQLLTLRLQAHERLILFIERINPSNLFVRLHQQGISVAELQSLILNEVKAEYQHNVTQQLYVSATIWDVVRKLKEDTLAMVNNGVRALPAEAEGIDLSKKVLQHMAGLQENPYELTLNLIKKDIHQLF